MKKILISLVLNIVLHCSLFGMDFALFSKMQQEAIRLAASVLAQEVQLHSKKLEVKKFSDTSSASLGDVNYCAGAIVRRNITIDGGIACEVKNIEYSNLEAALKQPKHSSNVNNVVVFSSNESYASLVGSITTAFNAYYRTVLGHPLTQLFPKGEFHIRKSDSEQKLLYALEDRNVLDPLKISSAEPLAYVGGTLVLYSVRNTCPFCNVAIAGFLATQIQNYIQSQPSLGIKNVHVFYSFDDPGSDRTVRSEKDRLLESMLLIQPNITYTQLPIGKTIELMVKYIISSPEIVKQHIPLLKQIYTTQSSGFVIPVSYEFTNWFVTEVIAKKTIAEASSLIDIPSFYSSLLSGFITNTRINILTTNAIKSDIVSLNNLPKNQENTAITNGYSALTHAIALLQASVPQTTQTTNAIKLDLPLEQAHSQFENVEAKNTLHYNFDEMLKIAKQIDLRFENAIIAERIKIEIRAIYNELTKDGRFKENKSYIALMQIFDTLLH